MARGNRLSALINNRGVKSGLGDETGKFVEALILGDEKLKYSFFRDGIEAQRRLPAHVCYGIFLAYLTSLESFLENGRSRDDEKLRAAQDALGARVKRRSARMGALAAARKELLEMIIRLNALRAAAPRSPPA